MKNERNPEAYSLFIIKHLQTIILSSDERKRIRAVFFLWICSFAPISARFISSVHYPLSPTIIKKIINSKTKDETTNIEENQRIRMILIQVIYLELRQVFDRFSSKTFVFSVNFLLVDMTETRTTIILETITTINTE